jgi:hypothetical protein
MMPITQQATAGEPDEPDRPSPATTEPYWRGQAWRPAPYRDTAGMLADLARRLLSALLHLRWQLSLTASVRTVVHAPDEQTAALTVTDALRHPETVIALSCAEPDAVPPWRALGTAERMELYLDVHAIDAGDGSWECSTRLLLAFTVEAHRRVNPRAHPASPTP